MIDKIKILLIDDNKVIHLLLKKILEKEKIKNVEHAYNGEEGFKKYKKFRPDLTILDISMPVLSGIGCLKKIIAFDPNAKVIMLTAMDQDAVIEKVHNIGACEFLSKPFKPEEVIDKIDKILKNKNKGETMFDKRKSGILLHPISLPSRYGIGDLGKESYRFIDFLYNSKQTIWQIIPLGHTDFNGCPYNCISAFAGNPLLISLELLVEDGLLEESDIDDYKEYDFSNSKINYETVTNYKYKKLRIAYKKFNGGISFEKFRNENKNWLDDYSLFLALKNHFQKFWIEWDEKLVHREKDALETYKNKLADEIRFNNFVQYLFYIQWFNLKKYANEKNIKIFGDIPIFVSLDSADVWANQNIFYLDENCMPTVISGVPPDYFSETGQLWGNPLYNWEAMEQTGFKWWVERFKHTYKLVDYVRIDHFRGFEAYWEVPAGEKTAVNGKWVKAKGEELFLKVKEELGDLPVIAEDLGVITEEVEKLRDKFNFPGMKILQFAFDRIDSEYLPHNFKTNNSIIYTGTHDNDTTLGWLKSLGEKEIENLNYFVGKIDENEFNWQFIRYAMASVSVFSIFPFQDILGSGSEGRINIPGKSEGNWSWRFTWKQLPSVAVERLSELTEKYNRSASRPVCPVIELTKI